MVDTAIAAELPNPADIGISLSILRCTPLFLSGRSLYASNAILSVPLAVSIFIESN